MFSYVTNANSVPTVIAPCHVHHAPTTSVRPICPMQRRSDSDQYVPSSSIRRFVRSRNTAFFSANLSHSKSCRASARTTRIPVRFSWSTVVMAPSASSESRKHSWIRRKKRTANAMITGKSASATIVIRTSSQSITGITVNSSRMARPISTIWAARNTRTVSTSDVHRCTRSPVSARS
jgi:hypothetical protein